MDTNQQSKVARDNSDIVFENDDFLIVRVYDSQSANYFISAEVYTHDTYFKNMIKGMEFYVIVNKKADGKAFSMIVDKKSNSLPIFSSYDKYGDKKSRDYDQIMVDLAPIEEELNDLFGNGSIYKTFKSFVDGKNVSQRDLEECDLLIKSVRPVKRSPSGSRVIVSFDVDEYLELFDMDEQYKDFAKYMLGGYHYNSWNFGTHDRSWEEWREGYILKTLNDNNLEKLKKIVTYINPAIDSSTIDEQNDSVMSNISEMIYSQYERFADRLMSEWADHYEVCFEDTAKLAVRDELCGQLTQIGFFIKEDNCYYEYFTTIGHILSLYQGIPKNWTLLQVLTYYMTKLNLDLNFEYVYYGECYNSVWDEKKYQEDMSKILDDFIETLESDDDRFIDRDEYINIYNKLTSKFQFNKWYPLPKDDSRQIEFKTIDPNTNLIHYRITGIEGKFYPSTSKGTYDDIMLILYHPELDLK